MNHMKRFFKYCLWTLGVLVALVAAFAWYVRSNDAAFEALADFMTFTSPEAFVIFGGLTKSGEYIMRPIRESFEKNVMPVFKGKAKILVSELKEADAAVLGASALGWEIKEA